MPDYPCLTLRPGRERSLHRRHPWIFSGALEPDGPDPPNGSPVFVRDAGGRVLATGTFSTRSQIRVRVLSFSRANLDRDFFGEKISRALDQRKRMGYGPGTQTTGFRLVFGESDGLAGLVADLYEDVLVLQTATPGIELLREPILEALDSRLSPRAVAFNNDLPSRAEEGLEKGREMAAGSLDGPVPFTENGLRFVSDVREGQKTGFFLDQKDLRSRLGGFCAQARVLNLFSYTGAAGVYALAGGAKSVLNVDSSERALSFCQEHAKMNGIPPGAMATERADAFSFLTEKHKEGFDAVFLDPPAIIKSAKDKDAGAKAYHFLNRAALSLVRPGGLFVTSSCSGHLGRKDFTFMLGKASLQARRGLFPLGFTGQSPDHPLSPYFPEAEYLKSAIFAVE